MSEVFQFKKQGGNDKIRSSENYLLNARAERYIWETFNITFVEAASAVAERTIRAAVAMANILTSRGEDGGQGEEGPAD